eukprot:5912380-Amphidinium_carterae.2
MLRIARSVEREPEKWIQHLDLQAYRACGSEQTGLPWSMSLYGERYIPFGRLETHERMADDGFSSQLVTLLSAKFARPSNKVWYAEEVGLWAWPLTGLAPISGCQGLAHRTEYAADMTALQWAIKKSETPAGAGPLVGGCVPKYGAVMEAGCQEIHSNSSRRMRTRLVDGNTCHSARTAQVTLTPFGRAILHLAHELASLRPGAVQSEPYIPINHIIQNWQDSWLLGVSECEGGELWLADGFASCRWPLPEELRADLPGDTLGGVIPKGAIPVKNHKPLI